MKTAWETWSDAGGDFAKKEIGSKKSIIELGEEAFRYAASRGLPHQDVIRRAFREGFDLKQQEMAIELYKENNTKKFKLESEEQNEHGKRKTRSDRKQS